MTSEECDRNYVIIPQKIFCPLLPLVGLSGTFDQRTAAPSADPCSCADGYPMNDDDVKSNLPQQ